jgi:chromosome segregation ATPase
LSFEAAEALEKIKISFDQFEETAYKKTLKKLEPTPEFQKTVVEMNERLQSLTKMVSKHNIDITNYSENQVEKSSIDQIEKKLESFQQNSDSRFVIIQSNMESRIKVIHINKVVGKDSLKKSTLIEEQLLSKINKFENSLNMIKEDVSMATKENTRLNTLVDTLGKDLHKMELSSQNESKDNQRLKKEIGSLTEKVTLLEDVTKNLNRMIQKIDAKNSSVDISTPRVSEVRTESGFDVILV